MISRIVTSQQRLEGEVALADFEHVSRLCKGAAERTFAQTKQNHLHKLEVLTRKKGPVNLR